MTLAERALKLGTHAYVGFNAAGEVCAVVFDDPGYEAYTAETVDSWIKRGYRMERMTNEAAVAALKGSVAKIETTT